MCLCQAPGLPDRPAARAQGILAQVHRPGHQRLVPRRHAAIPPQHPVRARTGGPPSPLLARAFPGTFRQSHRCSRWQSDTPRQRHRDQQSTAAGRGSAGPVLLRRPGDVGRFRVWQGRGPHGFPDIHPAANRLVMAAQPADDTMARYRRTGDAERGGRAEPPGRAGPFPALDQRDNLRQPGTALAGHLIAAQAGAAGHAPRATACRDEPCPPLYRGPVYRLAVLMAWCAVTWSGRSADVPSYQVPSRLMDGAARS